MVEAHPWALSQPRAPAPISGGAQSQPPCAVKGMPIPHTLGAEGLVHTPMAAAGVCTGLGWGSMTQGGLGQGSQCSA